MSEPYAKAHYLLINYAIAPDPDHVSGLVLS